MTANDSAQTKSLAARLLLRLINFYQKSISPNKPACCRYYPSCSSYAKKAIEMHGAFLGCLLTIWRILRCNPFSRGGYDPVPVKILYSDFAEKNVRSSQVG